MIPDDIRKDVGREGEDIACTFLLRRGYKIIARNFRKKWGEIDIIGEKEGTLRFVEVKAVSVPDFSREMAREPEELVQKSKLRKIARTAALYMEETNDPREFQIDVVGVMMDKKTRTARCRLIEQALDDTL
ncbi:YraN family protein [Candidatus Kaiserbacteria bacterium]|nr:YraN family protein [Candidatus Kaiserbacteria bacterium]